MHGQLILACKKKRFLLDYANLTISSDLTKIDTKWNKPFTSVSNQRDMYVRMERNVHVLHRISSTNIERLAEEVEQPVISHQS